jgi:hypothetical protein
MIKNYLFDISFYGNKRNELLDEEIFHLMLNYLTNIKELFSY